MRPILLSCAILAVLMLPAAASGRAAGPTLHGRSGYLVVQKAAGDGGVNGRPIATIVVQGFVLGHVSQRGQARIAIYQLPSAQSQGGPQAVGADVSTRPVKWRGFTGKEYSGSNFRFLAMGGLYRVVVRGSGIYLFAGGRGNVRLRGSSVYPHADGTYSIDGAAFRSLPSSLLKRQIGRG